jgi:hypothetical protein
VAVAACALLLSGCFGSGDDQEPTAHHGRSQHSRATEGSEPTSPATSGETSAPSGTATLAFSPRSGNKHTTDCEKLQPGDDPAQFLYYPVLITPSADLTLDSVTSDHTTGVVDAGSWVAPATPSSQTGTFKGWPPARIVTQGAQLLWGQRVPAQGATITGGSTYNVFLRLQVDPTPGDSTSRGLTFSFHDDAGSSTASWKSTTTFSMSC